MFKFFRKRKPRELLLPDLGRERDWYLLGHSAIDAGLLLNDYPPKPENEKKAFLFERALEHGLHGTIKVDRFSEIPLPLQFNKFAYETKLNESKHYFNYETDSDRRHWFLNFAHHNLFSGYPHVMFAQDEVQVAEFPALACIREWLLTRSDDLKPLTKQNGQATPILIQGLQRTLQIDTSQIYGARFRTADIAKVKASAQAISPKALVDILAIEAPIGSGKKYYEHDEIYAALSTAFSGFRAAYLTSCESELRPVVIHTGNWGCGAYGGNRDLMLTIQIIAAKLAGISEIVFYGNSSSESDALKLSDQLRHRFRFRSGTIIKNVVDRIAGARFAWGTPDGN